MNRLDEEIDRLTALRREELKLLNRAVRAFDDLDHRMDLVLSIPGIGERTALALVIRMPELGTLSTRSGGGFGWDRPVRAGIGAFQGRAAYGGRTGTVAHQLVRRRPRDEKRPAAALAPG